MDKHFYHAKGCLSLDICQQIIESFKNIDDSKKKLGPKNPYCLANKIHFYKYLQMAVAKNSIIYPALVENLKKYGELFPLLTNTSPWGINPKCMLQQYLPGEYYGKEHCEQGPFKPHIHRMLAWMFYLNDIDDGGGTIFPQQDIELKARAGDLYIWPAFWTHSHYGVPSKNQIKYIITGWCEYNVLEEAQEIS